MALQPRPAYRPADTLVLLVTIALGMNLVVDVLAIGSGLLQIDLLERAAEGALVTDEEANSNDLRHGVIAIAQLLVYVATIVVWLMWTFRARKNLDALGARGLQFSAGACIGWWFCPILNLWKPYQAVKEIFTNSRAAAGDAIVGLWWAAWIIKNLGGNCAMRLSDGEGVDEMIAVTQAALVADLAGLPAAVLAIMVVRAIQRGQEALSRSAAADVFE